MEQNDYLELSEDGKTVIRCRKDYEGAVVIPLGVTEIGDEAFFDSASLTSIEIPDSVTKIGNFAFQDCMSLTSIEIPNSVTEMGRYAFDVCTSLTSIEIPDSVAEIGTGAFAECIKLKEIIVDEGNVNYCSRDGVLYSKDMSRLIAVPGGKASIEISSRVTKICESAFNGCTSLTSIKIPDSVTKIGDWAFSDCSSLTSIKIPDSVIEIGSLTFSGCSSLMELHLRHKKPIGLSHSLYGLNLSKITLYVPIGTGYAYRHHPFYSQFKEVVIER